MLIRFVPTLSICICTSGRPVELERCLASIVAASHLPGEVVVSDDSTDAGVTRVVRDIVEQYPVARYLKGPSRGLCANRNHVIRHATCSHVSLIDDDATVAPDFVVHLLGRIARRSEVVFTGNVIESGSAPQPPTNPTFLGHFGRPVRAGDRLENIQLNCNVLPRKAFDAAVFDESITYGYEDTDLCAQLLAAGFEIVYAPELVNTHLPPLPLPLYSDRYWQAERARFYTTLKRHLLWRRNWRYAFLFLVIAPVHFAFHTVRQRRLNYVLAGWWWLLVDSHRLVRCRQSKNVRGKQPRPGCGGSSR